MWSQEFCRFLCNLTKIGSMAPNRGTIKCVECGAGMKCTGSEDRVLCPKGYYCPRDDVIRNCPVDTSSRIPGRKTLEECVMCPPGHYCGVKAGAEPSGLCDPGFFCPLGAALPTPNNMHGDGGSCKEGQYCPRGSSAPYSCPPGRFRGYCKLNLIKPPLYPSLFNNRLGTYYFYRTGDPQEGCANFLEVLITALSVPPEKSVPLGRYTLRGSHITALKVIFALLDLVLLFCVRLAP